MTEPVLIRVNTHGNPMPEVIEVGNWVDLRASETVAIHAGEYKQTSLGLSIERPEGYEAHVLPRSSTFKSWGIIMVNSMGVIDTPFNGDGDVWAFPAYATRDTVICKGDRIAQFRIVPVQPPIGFVEVAALGNKGRGGFGSTGRR